MSTTEPTTATDESPEAVPGESSALVAGNELVADSFGEYVGAQWRKIKSGESGVLPVIVGLIVIVIIFQVKNSLFLSHGNLVNLIEQSAIFIVLGMAEVFVLLLGDIDLAIGYNAGVGAIVTAELAAPPHNVNWALAILAGLATTTVIGLIMGLLITKIGLPSFIVTLAGYLGLQGFILYLISADSHASGGGIAITNNVLNGIVNYSLSPLAGWIVMIVGVAAFGVLSLLRDSRRRRAGLVTPPLGLTLIKITGLAIMGVVIVVICNQNRGAGFVKLEGVPWVVPIILVILMVYTFLLNRTRFGRYLYAIGGNAEASRRAGIRVNRIRLAAFGMAGFTAGIGGIIYESQLGGITSGENGGQLVLYAVAAAVIGGTSLFGGRGKMIHAVLGGVIIAVIANGLALLRVSTAGNYMINALVLLAAVTVDAVARRGRNAN
jgi:D-xylose transport system permease protein